jgi:hypothetical protein
MVVMLIVGDDDDDLNVFGNDSTSNECKDADDDDDLTVVVEDIFVMCERARSIKAV